MSVARHNNDWQMRGGRRAIALVLAASLAVAPFPAVASTDMPATAEGERTTQVEATDSQPYEVNGVEVHPEKVRPADVTADWSSFRGSEGTNHTTADVPTSATGAAWVRQVYRRQGSTDMSGISEPILVDGKVFVAVGSQLWMLDPSDGSTVRTADLVSPIDSTCRMAYADDVIVVPLHGGALQALTPDDLITVWVTPAVDMDDASDQQSLSTLTLYGDRLYVGTTDATKTTGCMRCVSLADGSVCWTYQTGSSAYYWAGAAATPHGLLVAQNSGELDLMSYDGTDGMGDVLASLRLPAQVCSTVVVSDGGSSGYVMCYDGTLCKVAVGDGQLELLGQTKLCGYSISTPTVVDGTLYVGGSAPGSTRKGALYVVDATTLQTKAAVTGLDDGSVLGGPVASSPLVATHDDHTYIYFTANDGIGGVYRYQAGDAEARIIYLPDEAQQQYTLSSVAVDASGGLYYINDSGNLFRLGGTAATWSSKTNGGDTPTSVTSTSSRHPKTTSRGQTSNDGGRASVSEEDTSADAATSQDASSSTSDGTADETGESDGSALSLLDEDASDTLESDAGLAGTTDQDAPASDEASSDEGTRLPVWPIVGMAAGTIVALMALLWHRGRHTTSPKASNEEGTTR